MATVGGGGPMPSGYGQAPKIRFEVISEAWQLFTQQMKTWVIAMVIFVVVMMVPGMVMGVVMVGSGLLGSAMGDHGGGVVALLGLGVGMIVGGLLLAVVATLLMGGLYRMAIKQIRGEPIELSDLWSITDVWMNLVGAGLLIGAAMVVGAMACIVPMYIVGGLLMLTIPLIVDKKMGVLEAATLSWNTLKQEWLMAAVLYFVLNFVAGLGAMALYIGMLFTYPLLFLGTALVYRDFILGGAGGTAVPADPYAVGMSPGGYAPSGMAPGGYTPGGYAPEQPAAPQPPPTEEPR